MSALTPTQSRRSWAQSVETSVCSWWHTHERMLSHGGHSENLNKFRICPSYKPIKAMLFRTGTSSAMINIWQLTEHNSVHQNSEHLDFFGPRNRWRVPSSLLWPGAHRSQLWGDEEGGLCGPAEAYSAQPTPFPPGKAFRCASACTRMKGPFGFTLAAVFS